MRISGWLFLIQQFFCALSLLVTVGACLGLGSRRPWRMLLVSLLCALACLGAALLPHPMLRLGALMPVLLLAPACAWPRLPRSAKPRLGMTSVALSLLCAGWARFLSSLGLSGTLLPLIAFLTLPLFARLLTAPEHTRLVTVDILCGSHHLCLTALVDSGNLLRDPLTGLPVVVISRQAAARLIPLPAPGEILPGMRLISVRTVAGASLMAIFRPSRVRLLLAGSWRCVDAMIGLSPSGYDGFQALVPAALTLAPSASEILSQGG